MSAAVQQTQPAAMMMEPPAFRENWKKIMASSKNEELRVIRVVNKVANITNEEILIRSPVDTADGFYYLSNQNELFPTKPYGWLSYPDTEQVRPPLETMKPLSVIPRGAITAFIALCDAARQAQATILADGRGMCWVQNSQQHVEFPLGITGEGFTFHAVHLRLALFELLRYDSVAIWKEERLDFGKTPFVLGLDWPRCVMIRPRESATYGY